DRLLTKNAGCNHKDCLPDSTVTGLGNSGRRAASTFAKALRLALAARRCVLNVSSRRAESRCEVPSFHAACLPVWFKTNEQTRSGCFRQTLQRPHRRVPTPAFQTSDNKPRCSHPPGEFLLCETGTVPDIHHRRSEEKLILKRLVSLSILRFIHPLLVHIRNAC